MLKSKLEKISQLCSSPHWTPDRKNRIMGLAAECMIDLERQESVNRTLSQLAQECLNAQNACNINIVHAISEALVNLRRLYPNEGTDFFNHHPIMKMWASKLIELTQTGFSAQECFEEAYNAVKKMAEGEK